MKKRYTQLFSRVSSHEFIELFSDKPYVYFSLSVLFSQIAFNMLSVVLIFLVFFLTSSNFSVSVLVLTILLPQILLSFAGGVVADRFDKRVILIGGNFLRAVVLILLFINNKSVILVYLVSIVTSSITQFYVPAETPLIPALVKKNHLIAANSIFGIGLFGSILVGYVLAGPAITTLGRSFVFLTLSATFALAALFAFFIPREIGKKKEITESIGISVKHSIRHEFKESVSLLKNSAGLTGAFFLLVFSQVIILVLATLVPGYAKSILQVPAEDLSVILFAPAALGMIVSALFISIIFKNKSKGALMTTGVIISGISLFLFPLTSKILTRGFVIFINTLLPANMQIDIYHIVLVLAFLAGFANALIFVPSQALIQEAIPESFRSKIYGLLFALIGVFSLFPIIISGTVADILGVGTVLILLGIIVIVIGIVRLEFKKIIAFAVKKTF